MDRKEYAVRSALGRLDELEKALNGRPVIDNSLVATEIMGFIESLNRINEEAKSMDESSVKPIPIEVFMHLDKDADNNPQLYEQSLIQSAKQRAEQIRIRGKTSKVIAQSLAKEIE